MAQPSVVTDAQRAAVGAQQRLAGGEAARELVPRIMPEAEHLISYHILLSGSCWGGVDGGEPIEMKAGDVIVFPHGNANLMSSDMENRAKMERALQRRSVIRALSGSDQTPNATLLSSAVFLVAMHVRTTRCLLLCRSGCMRREWPKGGFLSFPRRQLPNREWGASAAILF